MTERKQDNIDFKFPKSRTDSHLFIFPIDSNLSRIPIYSKGLKISKLNSEYVRKMLKRHGDPKIDDMLSLMEAFDSQDLCYVLSQTGNDNLLWEVYTYLKFIKPSTLKPLIKIDIEFYENSKGLMVDMPGNDSISIWGFNSKDLERPLMLHNSSKTVISRNFKEYNNRPPEYIQKLIGIYCAAMNQKGYVRFLTMMMIIESLITEDNQGVKYKVRRLCAVLLGNSIEASRIIFDNVGKLYDIRSGIVHSAKFDKLIPEKTEYLSLVCSEIINTLLYLRYNDGEISDVATKYGFGQRNLIFKEKKVNIDSRFFDNEIRLLSQLDKKEVKSNNDKKRNKQV